MTIFEQNCSVVVSSLFSFSAQCHEFAQVYFCIPFFDKLVDLVSIVPPGTGCKVFLPAIFLISDNFLVQDL